MAKKKSLKRDSNCWKKIHFFLLKSIYYSLAYDKMALVSNIGFTFLIYEIH